MRLAFVGVLAGEMSSHYAETECGIQRKHERPDNVKNRAVECVKQGEQCVSDRKENVSNQKQERFEHPGKGARNQAPQCLNAVIVVPVVRKIGHPLAEHIATAS